MRRSGLTLSVGRKKGRFTTTPILLNSYGGIKKLIYYFLRLKKVRNKNIYDEYEKLRLNLSKFRYPIEVR